jgi:hypothetical protein
MSRALVGSLKLSVAHALDSKVAQGRLDDKIRLYWGSQTYPQPAQDFGSFTALKRASLLHRTDEEACDWSLLSALIFLQNLAKEHGGNAVVNIRSVWLGKGLVSESEYGCDSATFASHVTLHAGIVKLS